MSLSADLAVRGERGEGCVNELTAPEWLRWVAPLRQWLALAVVRGSGAASRGLTICLTQHEDEQLCICTFSPYWPP